MLLITIYVRVGRRDVTTPQDFPQILDPKIPVTIGTDYWTLQGPYLVRVINTPRKSLFLQTKTESLGPQQLKPLRIHELYDLDDQNRIVSAEAIRDNWIGRGSRGKAFASRDRTTSWIGRVLFQQQKGHLASSSSNTEGELANHSNKLSSSVLPLSCRSSLPASVKTLFPVSRPDPGAIGSLSSLTDLYEHGHPVSPEPVEESDQRPGCLAVPCSRSRDVPREQCDALPSMAQAASALSSRVGVRSSTNNGCAGGRCLAPTVPDGRIVYGDASDSLRPALAFGSIGKRDQVIWGCGFCRDTPMRVSRRPGEEGYVCADHDVAPCAEALIPLQNPMRHQPYPCKRAQTQTGIATPEYTWPIESATLDGLVEEGLGHGDRTKGYVKPDGNKPDKYWNPVDVMRCREDPRRQSAQRPAMATTMIGAPSSSRGSAPPPPPQAQAVVQVEAVEERSSLTKRRSVRHARVAETSLPTATFVNTSAAATETAQVQVKTPRPKAKAPPTLGPQNSVGRLSTWTQPPTTAVQEGIAKACPPSQMYVAEMDAARQAAPSRLASTNPNKAFEACSAQSPLLSRWKGSSLNKQSAAHSAGIHGGSPEAPVVREASHDTKTSSEFEILNDPAWR